jgi:hypothetical protein
MIHPDEVFPYYRKYDSNLRMDREAKRVLAGTVDAFPRYRYIAQSILRFRGMGRLQITDNVPV